MHEERDTLWCILWSTANLIMSQFGHVCESKCNIMRSNKIINSWLHALCSCKQTLPLGKFPRYHLLLKTRMSKSTAIACETGCRNIIIFLPDKRYEMHQHKICKFFLLNLSGISCSSFFSCTHYWPGLRHQLQRTWIWAKFQENQRRYWLYHQTIRCR